MSENIHKNSFIDKLLIRFPMLIPLLPEGMKTKERLTNIVLNNDKAAFYTPKYINDDIREKVLPVLTNDDYVEAIKNDPANFSLVPEERKTKGLCFIAFEGDKKNLQFFPDYLLTPDILKDIIKDDPACLKYIRKEFQTQELCDLALSYDKHEPVKTPEFYKDLVTADPHNLCTVPLENRTRDLCTLALENSFYKNENEFKVLAAVPYQDVCIEGLKTIENKLNVIKFIDSLPENMLSKELIEIAVNKNCGALLYTPFKMITPEICLQAAIKDERFKNGSYAEYIPNEIRRGNNIFSFARKLEKITGEKFSYDEICKKYKGESIKVNGKEYIWNKRAKLFQKTSQSKNKIRKQRGL